MTDLDHEELIQQEAEQMQTPTQQPIQQPTQQPQQPVQQSQQPAQQQQMAQPMSTEQRKLQGIADHFKEIALATVLYAVFYTFCLYKNLTGITFPFFVGGTLFYLCYCMKTLGMTQKKDSIFYIICSVLLGISTVCTDSSPIHVFNFMGILLLIGSFMVHQTYEDKGWDFSKYLGTVLYTGVASVAHVLQPFIHLSYYRKTRAKKEGGKGKYVWYGILIAAPLLLIVLTLLSSADVVFANTVDWIFKLADIVPADLFGIVFLTLFVFFAAYSFLCSVVSKDLREEVTDKRVAEPIVAITFTSVLTAVYLLFCSIQIIYLFIGGMEIPEGYTYARYARQGYFQLLFVCLINLVMVLACLRRFREHKVLKMILTVLSGCTYIMIASSAYRMILYVSTFCLTFTRVLVLWSLVVLTVLLTGIVICIYKPVFPLFRFCMIVVTVSYLGLSFSHQDYWIAKYNLVSAERYPHFNMDIHYLHQLSDDKIPAMVAHMDEEQLAEYNDNYMMNLYTEGEEAGENLNFRTWNLSRFIAYQSVKSLQ